jgi:hypothetical protein
MPANVDMLVRMKLSNQAATEVTSAQGQGIASLDNFSKMDKEGVELVFRQLARPGGVDAAGNQNPGIKISAVSQLNFGLMCYYVRHKQDRVDRVITFASVTLAAVKQLRAQELLERNHKDPTIVPTINFKNWAKTMESLDQ